MDGEPNNAEKIDELRLLLVQRGLTVLPPTFLLQPHIAKLRVTQVSSFLAGIVTSIVYWGVVLIVIGSPIATTILALVVTLAAERLGWFLLTLVKLYDKSLDMGTFLTRRTEGIVRLLAFYGWMLSLTLLNAIAIWVALLFVSNSTGDNILQRLYALVVSIPTLIPFDRVGFYVTVFAITLGVFALMILIAVFWYGMDITLRNISAAAIGVLIVLGFTLFGALIGSVPMILMFGAGIVLLIAGSTLGAVFIISSLQVVLAPLVVIVTIASSALVINTSRLGPVLLRLSATVLGVTLLAALIPFLNADAWQMIASISWTNLVIVALFVYLGPLSGLLYTQRGEIREMLRSYLEASNKGIELEALLETYRSVQHSTETDTEQTIRSSYRNLEDIHEVYDPHKWNLSIKLKNLIMLLLLVLALPILVAVFCAFFFYFMLDSQVLLEWTRGYLAPTSTRFLPLAPDELTMLTIKAALLFGLVSSAIALGTQFSSEDNVHKFMREAFIDDMMVDRHLLVLNEICKRGGDREDRERDGGDLITGTGEYVRSDRYNVPAFGAGRFAARDSTTAHEGKSSISQRSPTSSKIDEEAEKLLEANVRERPAATLAERRQFLEEASGLRVSKSTISRRLKGLGYIRTNEGWVREGGTVDEP
jgi:hypothetical protein